MGQTQTKSASTHSDLAKLSTNDSTNSEKLFKPKKHLTRIELVCLQYIFNDLKSTFPESFACIEPKNFLEHLKIPEQVEPAAVLLFKAFSYLGSYPFCTENGPIPLSFDAFITAFVIIVGKLDEPDHKISENLFFTSLSILPAPTEDDGEVVGKEEVEEEVVIVQPKDIQPSKIPRGLSLAELGVDFDDMDIKDDDSYTDEIGSRILVRDLIELFVFLIWLGESDREEHDFDNIRKLAIKIVNSIKSNANNEETDELPCVSHKLFSQWKDRFSPHLFKPLQSFITKSFAYYDVTRSKNIEKIRLLSPDTVPVPDKTDILTPILSTILSWSLPENILMTKTWSRLYSADQDGFSMNRFEKHVFKYPGPTLLLCQVDAISSTHAMLGKTSPKDRTWVSTLEPPKSARQPMLFGIYISQPWKESKQFWGTTDCFLFELDPTYDIYRPIIRRNSTTRQANSDHFIYYHREFGIGFGSTNSHIPLSSSARSLSSNIGAHNGNSGFILFLQNTLQEGFYENEAYPSQPSFESSIDERRHTDFFYKFDTVNIEVFGLGNEKDRLRQAKEWQFEKQEADRRAGLNIRQMDGNLDKELLKMAGIIDENRQDR